MPIYSKRMQLAAQFATAARLYAEAVALLTADSLKSPHDYNRLLQAVQEAQQGAEFARLTFQEHVESASARSVNGAGVLGKIAELKLSHYRQSTVLEKAGRLRTP